MEPSGEPSERPSAWQRVIAGIIGVPLAGIGLFLIVIGALWAAGDCVGDGGDGFAAAAGALNARPAASDEVPCWLFPLFILLPGVGMALVGVPFAIAAFVPFGTFRRVMVGVGVAAIGGIVGAVALALVFPWAAVLALPAAVGFFYLGYRKAR